MSEPTRRPLTTAVRYVDWLVNPWQRRGVPALYELLGTRTLTARGRYLNLGDWATATDPDGACEALVAQLAERLALGPEDLLLDVGFGFADQDLYWWRHYRPRRIVGLNLTQAQVEAARRRVAAAEPTAQIDLRHGSATAMPIAAGSVDKVAALECAFHFRTRERFFDEAWRVLRPGGRLALADILPLPLADEPRLRRWQRGVWHLAASRFAIPRENAYVAAEYAAKLRAAGFVDARVESIRDRVYAPLHDYLRRNPAVVKRLHPLLALAVTLALRVPPERLFAGLDYVLASAVKPSGA